MHDLSESRNLLSCCLYKNQIKAFRHHNKIMKFLEESGFTPNPEQKIFSHIDQEKPKEFFSPWKMGCLYQ